MNGELVGVWSQGRTGHHRFIYDQDWVNSPRARAVSLSLPITASGQIEGSNVENFFDNLLPDSETIRRRLRDRFKTGSVAAFKLLEAIGRDCVGAIQLLPAGEKPVGLSRLEYAPLNEADVARILRNVTAEQEFEQRVRQSHADVDFLQQANGDEAACEFAQLSAIQLRCAVRAR